MQNVVCKLSAIPSRSTKHMRARFMHTPTYIEILLSCAVQAESTHTHLHSMLRLVLTVPALRTPAQAIRCNANLIARVHLAVLRATFATDAPARSHARHSTQHSAKKILRCSRPWPTTAVAGSPCALLAPTCIACHGVRVECTLLRAYSTCWHLCPV